MKKIGMSILAATALASTMAMAGGDIEPAKAEVSAKKGEVVKRKLKGNMVVEYNVLPGSTESLTGMFQDGIFYGRLRSNSFYWDWDDEDYDTGGKRKDNKNMGVGGSLIFKSAVLNGFSFTAGYYGSLNPGFWRMDEDEVGYAKSGKDTFSRYNVSKTGSYGGGMHVLGQAYLEYKNSMFDIKAGRQLFESVFTASNDTKMIPNTFDGVTVAAKVADKTTARVAYFAKQKLRDHTSSHDVVTFNTAEGDKWNNNDDSAIHKGLNYDAFIAAGEDPDHELIVADLKTKIIPNLDATLSLLSVPGVVKDIVAEAHYTVPMDNGWAVRPGFRYFYQMDDGAGAVNLENPEPYNLAGKSMDGYSDGAKTSLDSSLFAARVDMLMPEKKGFFRLGYSQIADEADILAPWRGFPTGGFTRAMAQYNWYANTKTYMARAAYNFTPKFNASLRYAVQDFDDDKSGVQADSTVWHLDTVYKFTPNFYMKTRVGLVDADTDSGKSDVSYNEYRLEFNYLF